METHEQYEAKKKRIIEQFLEGKKSNQSIGLDKKTSNLFRTRQKAQAKLDVRTLNNVISVDPVKLLAEVEGMTTFDDFTKETLKFGCLPAVVPELKTITIGGGVSGGAIESSSFKFGLVHETVEAMEILLGTGEVITATRTNEHKDIFYGFANSYGTLGYILKLTVKLVKAKKYVKLEHKPYSDAKIYFKDVEKYCTEKKHDYVDGTVFSEKEMYITLATFVDDAPTVSSYKVHKMFFKSIQHKKEDYLTAYDYIWRWDKDWFWCSKHFGMHNKVARLTYGLFLRGSANYWKIMAFNRKHKLAEKARKILGKKQEQESVIQDVQIPVRRSAEFLAFFNKEVGITPVWICPTKPAGKERYPLYDMDPETLYVNFGFWDVVELPEGQKDGYFNGKVEAWVAKLNGRKGLYSTAFYTEEEFWKHYNKAAYDKLKKKYDPQKTFKNLYEKTVLKK